MGIVHLRGLLKSGTQGTIAFILPVGYRPSSQEVQIAYTNGGAGRVDIDNKGNVYMQVADPGYISLDGITFRASE